MREAHTNYLPYATTTTPASPSTRWQGMSHMPKCILCCQVRSKYTGAFYVRLCSRKEHLPGHNLPSQSQILCRPIQHTRVPTKLRGQRGRLLQSAVGVRLSLMLRRNTSVLLVIRRNAGGSSVMCNGMIGSSLSRGSLRPNESAGPLAFELGTTHSSCRWLEDTTSFVLSPLRINALEEIFDLAL